jgi:hypothetical protein
MVGSGIKEEASGKGASGKLVSERVSQGGPILQFFGCDKGHQVDFWAISYNFGYCQNYSVRGL